MLFVYPTFAWNSVQQLLGNRVQSTVVLFQTFCLGQQQYSLVTSKLPLHYYLFIARYPLKVPVNTGKNILRRPQYILRKSDEFRCEALCVILAPTAVLTGR